MPTAYLSYLAFDKVLGITKGAQEVRDLILSKSGLDNIDGLLKKYNQQDDKVDEQSIKNDE